MDARLVNQLGYDFPLPDGGKLTDETYRTAIIKQYAKLTNDTTVIDIAGGIGYEARALALKGVRRAVMVEGKGRILNHAREI